MINLKPMFLFIALLFSINLSAQNWEWGRGNTGAYLDAWPVATDPSGNIFVAGISGELDSSGVSAIFGSQTIPPAPGNLQCIIAKYDPSGNFL